MSLKHLLEQASKAYYEGKPIMPDYQFDEIAKLYDWKNVGYEGNEDRIKPVSYTHLTLPTKA